MGYRHFKSIAFLLAVLLSPVVLSAADTDQMLHEALRKSNSGDTQGAISLLESLARQAPSDERVFQSLGLIYQSRGETALAIQNLEKAVSLKPLPDAWYGLGLLYEAQWLSVRNEPNRMKAFQAWDQFLKIAPANHPRLMTGRKHWEKLQQP